MNKRFSTLLAAALVAGGLSSTASATAYADDAVTNGSWVHLQTEGTAAKVLAIDAQGALTSITTPTAATWASATEANLASLWRVNKTAKQGTTGTYFTYTFTSKTGQLLSIKLVSDVKGGGREAVITTNEKGGNTEWLWDDAKGLYAYNAKGDSVFTLDYNSGIVLHAEKATQGVLPTDPTTKALVMVPVDGSNVVLNATAFNAFAKDSKLYFPGANVSEGQKNVLTDKKWEAVDGKIVTNAFVDPSSSPTHIFLTVKGETHKGSNLAMNDVEDKATYLVVDYKNYYDGSKSAVYPYLLADSIAVEPTVATVPQIAARTAFSAATGKGTPRHPFTAAFTAKYDIQKDSISLEAAYVESKIAVTTMLDGRISAFTALETALSTASTTQCDALKTEVNKLKTAVAAYYAAGNQTKYTTATVFTAANFEANGAVDNGSPDGGEVTGQDIIDAIGEIEVTYTVGTNDEAKAKIAAEKAYVAAVDALVSAIEELAIVTNAGSAPAVVTTKSLAAAYSDGAYAGLEVEEPANKQIVIRDNAGTKTLTIGDADKEIVPAIRFSNSSSLGGDAEIEAGLYYVVDKMKGLSNDSKTYDLYIVQNEDMGIKYVANAQPFNPYAIYNVENAAGTTKGNFYITALTNNSNADYSGITNTVDAENGVYAIGGDTIQLVKADVTVDKHMGYKFMTAPELANNTFTITSAIDVLDGYGFAMKAKADSAIYAIDGDETAYTLVAAGDPTKYGTDDALEKQAYYIKDADGNFVIYDATTSTYRFANETGDIAADKVAFYLLAVGSESTYVLVGDKNTNAKLIVESRTKQIISEPTNGEKNNTFFVAAVPAPASYKSLPKHASIKALNGDNIAVNAANQGVVAREGDLKAAYTAEDFTFWLDTAHYENAETFTYYVTKGTEDARLFMYNSVDSAKVQDADKKFPYIYGTDASRVIFMPAAVMAQDTLIVNGTDTVSVAKGTSKDGLKHAVKAGVTNFQFSFEFASKDAEGQYNIVCQNKNGKNYVHNINGVLAMGVKENALVVDVKDAEAPTANEGVEVSEVKVIAGEGQVTIAGAAGKKVAVSNILGRTVANTVITSDNAVIAAPQGVVIVAVEGEETVKAIVK